MITDKEYSIQKKRVLHYLNKWKLTLGLGAHKLNLEWDRGLRTGEDQEDVAIHCTNSWQYRLVTLYIYLPVIKRQTDEELEHIIVHEFAHSLIAPLAQRAPEDIGDLHEFATECVAQAILWAYERGKEEDKKR